MAASKKTLVLGASANPERYSNMAIQRLRSKGHSVVGIGRSHARVADVDIATDPEPIPGLDTVTIYMNPSNQKNYYNYILAQHPRRIIFNPGAENEELSALARHAGIEPVEACTLVLLTTGQY